jgi:hypothetical protein
MIFKKFDCGCLCNSDTHTLHSLTGAKSTRLRIMGRELQKKKNRSSVSKSRPKVSKRTKTGRRKVDFGNNEILSRNWYNAVRCMMDCANQVAGIASRPLPRITRDLVSQRNSLRRLVV